MNRNRLILLVEDNPNDVELTLRAFQKSNVMNEIVVVSDGEEAIHYLFATGPHAARDPKVMPEVVLLDMKLPKVDGLGVLRKMRADERTKRLPVVDADIKQGRKRRPFKLRLRCKQLRPQTGGLRRIRGSGKAVGSLLAGDERTAAINEGERTEVTRLSQHANESAMNRVSRHSAASKALILKSMGHLL